VRATRVTMVEVVVPVPQIVAPVVVVVADIQLLPIMVVGAEAHHTRAAVRLDLPILRMDGKAEAEVERGSLRPLVLVEQVVRVDIMPGARGSIQGMPVQSLLDMAPAVVAGGAEMQTPP